jgi:hypothetical protein
LMRLKCGLVSAGRIWPVSPTTKKAVQIAGVGLPPYGRNGFMPQIGIYRKIVGPLRDAEIYNSTK